MRKFDRVLLIAAALVLAIFPLSGAGACELQPINMNPAELPGIEFTRLASQTNITFMAGNDSQRFYDHVEPLDGITIGFGHWPQAEVAKFFKEMKAADGGKVFAAFSDCMAEFFGLKREKMTTTSRIVCDQARSESTEGIWVRAQQAAGIPPAAVTRERVTDVLNRTLLSNAFMMKYAANCKKDEKTQACLRGQPNLFAEHRAWLVPALCHALRDRVVVLWQVDFWTDTIIRDAADFAPQIGLAADEAAIVALAAYRSSSGRGAFKPLRQAAETGLLSAGGFRWNWNQAPDAAKSDSNGMKKWRRFILWQHYAVKHQKFRPRSIKFYELYLADDWVLPALDRSGRPDWKDRRNFNPALVKPRT